MRRFTRLRHTLTRIFSIQSQASHRCDVHVSQTSLKPLSTEAQNVTAAFQEEDPGTDILTPWSVVAKGPQGIDYNRVLSRFKACEVDEAAIEKLLEVTRKVAEHAIGIDAVQSRVHHFFSRQVVFSHRDFELALSDIEESLRVGQKRVFLYTGRGPSARGIHIGHFIPFLLTKYLQDALDLPLVIQISDDEKYLFRGLPFTGDAAEEVISSNIKDIIAFGFNPLRTFIFRNTHFIGDLYPTVLRLQKVMTCNAIKHTLGIEDSDNIGKLVFPAVQAAPCFSSTFRRVMPHTGTPLRCLVPCAIDQDPFFVLARSASPKLGQLPPALLYTKFLPALKGLRYKMSSSEAQNGLISAHDTNAQIQMKLRKAFSGGKATLSAMREQGADLDVDVAYQLLKFFCVDEDLFRSVTELYGTGKMDSGEVKNLVADVLIRRVLMDWRERRLHVTDDQVEQFCAVRSILV